MPKGRFSSADVRAVVRDIRSKLLGLRVINVYDVSAKTYLIKLGAPGMHTVAIDIDAAQMETERRHGSRHVMLHLEGLHNLSHRLPWDK